MQSHRLGSRLAVFLALAGMAVCWALATPLFGISDEPAQVMKAAAAVRGQLVGKPAGGPNTVVEIPGNLIGDDRLPCFMRSNSAGAGCAPPLGQDTRPVPEMTWTGYYPPLYYLAVGWPSLVFKGAAAVYAMRVVAAVLGAALLAAALLAAAESAVRRLLLPTTAALATPYVFAYVGTVNPSGMEMASALCAWTAGVALLNGPANPRTQIRLVVGLAVLTQVRDFGPLFAGVIVATLAALYGLRAAWGLLRRPAVRFAAALVAVGGAFTAAWVLLVANLSFVPGKAVEAGAGPLTLLGLSARRYLYDLVQIVGDFGWSNRLPPWWASVLGLALLLGLGVLGFHRAAKRVRQVVGALLAFSIVFPIAVVAVEARHQGLLGQGRYWYPLLAGVVLVAAGSAGNRLDIPLPGARRLPDRPAVTGMALITLTVHLAGFLAMLESYRSAIGPAGTTLRTSWNPPGGPLLWPLAYAVLATALAGWWWHRVTRQAPAPLLPARAPTAASRTG